RLDKVHRGIVNLSADLGNIPLESNTVTHVLIWHVLEHVPDDAGAVKEIHRVLCPGGSMLVSVPIFPPGRQTTFDDPAVPRNKYLSVFGHDDHVRACGLDYSSRLIAGGFRIKELLVKVVAQGEQELFGLSQNHVVWCCEKEGFPQFQGAFRQ